MNYFSNVEDGHVLLRSRGVFRQEPLYQRGGRLYAKWGVGFIGLMSYQQATTHPHVAWVELTIQDKEFKAVNGALYLA
jgi:hypothetical protein